MARVSRRAMNRIKNEAARSTVNVVKEATEAASKNIDDAVKSARDSVKHLDIPKVNPKVANSIEETAKNFDNALLNNDIVAANRVAGASQSEINEMIRSKEPLLLNAPEEPKRLTREEKIARNRRRNEQQQSRANEVIYVDSDGTAERKISNRERNIKRYNNHLAKGNEDIIAANEKFFRWADQRGYDLLDDASMDKARKVFDSEYKGPLTREEKIARNRRRNAQKEIDNGVINAEGRVPLMLEDYETKVNNAYKMSTSNDKNTEEIGEKLMNQLSHDNSNVKPYRKLTPEQIKNNEKAFYGQHIPKEYSVDKKIAEPNKNNQNSNSQSNIKGNNFVYQMATLGVGGALVLNMSNNRGQQSNAQLYGQY